MTDTDIRGLVVVDKPTGVTSHKAVARLAQVLGTSKAGHAGTLDPEATGVLLVLAGRVTRLASFLQALPKSYRAVAKFGVSTSTQDATGEVIATLPATLTAKDVAAASRKFTGEVRQIPPQASAVKVQGVPAYKAFRRGQVVTLKERRVMIHRFDIEDFDPQAQTAKIYVSCSSGAYIRTLASDLGDALGCGAHLLSLRRLSVGSFTEADGAALEELEAMTPSSVARRILSPKQALRDFPRLTVTGEDRKSVVNGVPLETDFVVDRPEELPVVGMPSGKLAPGSPVAVLDDGGELLAVYTRSAKGFKPAAVLV